MDKSLWTGLLVALAALPLGVIALSVARGNLNLINGIDADRVRDPAAAAAQIARWMGAMALLMLAAGGGFVWAGADEQRSLWVTLALILLLNAAALGLVFAVAAIKRDYRPLPPAPTPGHVHGHSAAQRPAHPPKR